MASSGAKLKEKDSYVYFLYSEQQYQHRSEIEKKMSRIFSPGTVIVSGRKKLFTEMSKSSSNRYPDCKIVAEGYKSKFLYTSPTNQ